MCLNPVNEEFDRAYANVGLLASDVWSFQKEEVDYKKANLYLWIRFNETEKRLIEEGTSDDDHSTVTEEIRTVQDVIPFSRLASYNDFVYDEERERMYVADDEMGQCIQNSYHLGQKDLEIWMLSEVDNEFKRYMQISPSRWCVLSPRIPSGRELVPAEQVITASPFQWLCETRWPDQLMSRYADKFCSLCFSTHSSLFREDMVIPNYEPVNIEQKLIEYPCPRYLIETNIDHKLHEIISSPAVRNLWATPSYSYGGCNPSFGLNAEVPEFQPVTVSSKCKGEGEHFDHLNSQQMPNSLHQVIHGLDGNETNFDSRQQQFVSIFDMNYEAEMFPYSNTANGYTLQPEVVPLGDSQAVQSVPVFLRPPGSYFNVEPMTPVWKKQQGVVLSNVMQVTDSEQCGVVVPLEQQLEPWGHIPPIPPQRLMSDTKIQNTKKMVALLEKLVKKIYNPRTIDFKTMSSSSTRIDKIFQDVQQNYCSIQGPATSQLHSAQRPLYSDVLMSEGNATVSCSDSKFDELEQEALEQYSGSDTTLMVPPPPAFCNVSVAQSKLQGSKKEDIESAKSSPRLQPPDWTLQASSFESPDSVIDLNRGVRLADIFTRQASLDSVSSKRSCSSGSKRLNDMESEKDACCPNKQAKWMKKKKKKSEKKKKCGKHKKKPNIEPNRKLIDSEIMSINKVLDLSSTFNKTFFQSDWKLVHDPLPIQVKNLFEKCLNNFEECLEWFMHLVTNRDPHEDYIETKKRVELMKSIAVFSENILRVLYQYINLYSKIQMSIPCDHRLYLDPSKLVKQRPLTDCHLQTTHANQNSLSQKVGLLTTVPNGKYLLKLLDSVIQEENLTLIFKHEWKLPHICENTMSRRTYEIQINFKEWRIHLAESSVEKDEPTLNVNRSLVKIVEDFPIWYSWQWKFIDGWNLDMSDSSFSFHWYNRFDVRVLEQIAMSARLFVMCDWLLDLIDAVVLNKHYPSCELLWNRKIPNLVSSKMVFLRLLLKGERNWYFGDVRINQQACCRLYSGCENPCCVSWILNHDSARVNISPTTSLVKVVKKKEPKILVRPIGPECKKEEAKSKKNFSKSKIKNSLPTENQLIFNEIVNEQNNLPQEKSPSCVIQ